MLLSVGSSPRVAWVQRIIFIMDFLFFFCQRSMGEKQSRTAWYQFNRQHINPCQKSSLSRIWQITVSSLLG